MADLIVVDELRTYLISQGVVQSNDPEEAPPSQTIPSVWVAPRQGAPEPRREDGTWLEDATVTLIDTGLGSPSTLEPFLEEAFIDIIVRAHSAGRAQLIHRTIRGLLVPGDAVGGRKNWTMGAIDPVERSFLWRADQPLSNRNDGLTDSRAESLTYDRVQSFCFQVRASALTA